MQEITTRVQTCVCSPNATVENIHIYAKNIQVHMLGCLTI